jgi:hypothetical protein
MAKRTKEEIRAFERKALEPYQLALGKVGHAWNHMQEQLGILFCGITGLDDATGLGIWHALKSDRTQRDLLEAAVTAATSDENFTNDFPKAKEDLLWMLKKVNALAEGRNSAIHAPVFGYSEDFGATEFFALTDYRNPNAAKLGGKDILAEFEWYESYFNAIKMFAGEISLSLSGRRRANSDWLPWPDRPLLPTVRQKSGRQDHSRRPDSK